MGKVIDDVSFVPGDENAKATPDFAHDFDVLKYATIKQFLAHPELPMAVNEHNCEQAKHCLDLMFAILKNRVAALIGISYDIDYELLMLEKVPYSSCGGNTRVRGAFDVIAGKSNAEQIAWASKMRKKLNGLGAAKQRALYDVVAELTGNGAYRHNFETVLVKEPTDWLEVEALALLDLTEREEDS